MPGVQRAMGLPPAPAPAPPGVPAVHSSSASSSRRIIKRFSSGQELCHRRFRSGWHAQWPCSAPAAAIPAAPAGPASLARSPTGRSLNCRFLMALNRSALGSPAAAVGCTAAWEPADATATPLVLPPAALVGFCTRRSLLAAASSSPGLMALSEGTPGAAAAATGMAVGAAGGIALLAGRASGWLGALAAGGGGGGGGGRACRATGGPRDGMGGGGGGAAAAADGRAGIGDASGGAAH